MGIRISQLNEGYEDGDQYEGSRYTLTTLQQTTTKPTDLYQLQESRLDTIYRRHRVRFRSDHHTYQHTHCQQNFHKHHTDGRQAEHTKGQDAQQLQALARRHSMQNHSKK